MNSWTIIDGLMPAYRISLHTILWWLPSTLIISYHTLIHELTSLSPNSRNCLFVEPFARNTDFTSSLFGFPLNLHETFCLKKLIHKSCASKVACYGSNFASPFLSATIAQYHWYITIEYQNRITILFSKESYCQKFI